MKMPYHGWRENRSNKSGIRSRYRGVSWSTQAKKWVAQINGPNGNKYLGLFESEENAAKAYDAAARELFGRFATLNFKEH